MITAAFPAGVAHITVNGLHQWDYGQRLEIHADDLPALVEVHFACPGMKEAVVRSCAVLNGVATVAIPDQCLEQTAPIVAWVYEIDGTTGTTTKTITLPVKARIRPQPSATVPQEISDRYTELITAINTEVATLKEGNVTVENARNAASANYAEEAGYAGRAGSAEEAEYAYRAGAANSALYATSTGAKTISEMNEKALWRVGGLYLILTPGVVGTFRTELLLIASAGGFSYSTKTESDGWYYNHETHELGSQLSVGLAAESYAYQIAQLN